MTLLDSVYALCACILPTWKVQVLVAPFALKSYMYIYVHAHIHTHEGSGFGFGVASNNSRMGIRGFATTVKTTSGPEPPARYVRTVWDVRVLRFWL